MSPQSPTIQERIHYYKSELPDHVTLVAVSKFHPQERLLEAYQAGHRILGESRVQELLQKQQQLPDDIQWHFIGHLQTNKVELITPFISLIQSVDSIRLLERINSSGAQLHRVIPCLLEVKIAQDDSKYGFTEADLQALLAADPIARYPFIGWRGLMAMGSLTDNKEITQREFSTLHDIFIKSKEQYFHRVSDFQTLSMGMSDDYRLAIASGSTMVRIGSDIFGTREY